MPYFYQEDLSQDFFDLASEEAKHITKALRMKVGDTLWVTDGKGTLSKAKIINLHKDSCRIQIVKRCTQDIVLQKKLHLAIAPTKNPDRMEWLVEKAVEIGVTHISLIICDRSERKHIDTKRLNRIAIAALKQSQSTWLAEIQTCSFMQFINENKISEADKFIAYCDRNDKSIYITEAKYLHNNAVFLIGPEGDFTPQEVHIAIENGFKIISLGEKILRTETAGLFVLCCYKGAGGHALA